MKPSGAGPAPRRRGTPQRQATRAAIRQATDNPSSANIVSAISAMHSEFSADIDSLKDDVGTLKDDVGTLKDDVGALKDDVGTLKDDVGTLKDVVGALTVNVDKLLHHFGLVEGELP